MLGGRAHKRKNIPIATKWDNLTIDEDFEYWREHKSTVLHLPFQHLRIAQPMRSIALRPFDKKKVLYSDLSILSFQITWSLQRPALLHVDDRSQIVAVSRLAPTCAIIKIGIGLVNQGKRSDWCELRELRELREHVSDAVSQPPKPMVPWSWHKI